MGALNSGVALVYLVAAVAFAVGLHLMNSPATARRGNQISAAGMVLAVAATLAKIIHDGSITGTGWAVMGSGALIGALAGLRMARKVQMTAIPQLVSLFNAVGGGAAALVALVSFVRLVVVDSGSLSGRAEVSTVLDVLIGAVTFSGSVVAAGKLQGWVSGSPIVFRGTRAVSAGLAVAAAGSAGAVLAGTDSSVALAVLAVAALGFGVVMVLPIGGADMPVVISLLNSCTGVAVAMAGFVIDNSALIIAGALVGASGAILTKLMADAMNRSIGNIIVGGFGTGDSGSGVAQVAGGTIRQLSSEDVAIQLAYANKVVIVPGYGLAAAQAQHELRGLADLLEAQGVEVAYAIHPVAGRMPGHMNVLLAEANVPYTQLEEMEQANTELPSTDVALVVGANDVTNPAARRPDTPISGMPIIDVDRARRVIVIKRSMGHGYAGIDNELYTLDNTGMFFADAKAGLAQISAAVKALVAS